MIFKTLAVVAASLVAVSAQAATTTITFDDFTAPGFSGNFTIFPGAGSPNNAATVNGTPFLAVPSENTSGGIATYTAAAAITAFSFDWGTPDSYNTLTFVDGNGGSVASYNGSVGGTGFAASYTFAASSNVRSVRFESSQKAFEIDNVSVGTVPEPATWGLMLAGFGMVGFAARRRASGTVAA